MQEVQTTLAIGRVLRERYVVEDLLGRGGSGAVYLVRDLRVRQNVFALKEVVDPDKKERERFLFEGELLRRLEHRALPRVYRVFDEESQHRAYMLMDYIEGPNLEQLRQELPEKRFPVSQVLTFMAPIMDALTYLHSQTPAIIHRDIKPANIIGPRTGDEAVLVDFGIAKEYDPNSTTTAVRRCTPGYAPPEQYATGTNPRTDIYGLGATLYTLLTGIIPVDAFYRLTQLNSQGTDPLFAVNKLVPSVPQHISDAISRAMSVNSADRFSSVEEFWQELDVDFGQRELVVTTVSPPVPAFPATPKVKELCTPVSSAVPIAASPSTSDSPSIAGVPSTLAPPSIVMRQSAAPSIAHPATVMQQKQQRVRSTRKSMLLLSGVIVLLLCLAIASVLLAYIGSHPALSSAGPRSQQTVTTLVSPIPPTPVVRARATFPTPKPTPTPMPTSLPVVVPPAPPTVVVVATPKPIPTARPTPKPTPTPAPVVYPNVAGNYNGTIDDTTSNITTSMSLSISQKSGQGAIHGNFVVGPALLGSGPFTGKVATNKYIEFTVASYHGNAPLFFYGWVQSDGSLKGDYCSVNKQNQCDPSAGDGGTWDVVESSATPSVMGPS